MAKDNNDEAEEEGKKGGPNMIVIGIVGVVLLAGGIFAGPMVQNMLAGEPEPIAEGEEEAAEMAAEPAGKDAIYQAIHPPLLINFSDDRGRSRFLQISLEVMAREESVIEAIKTHNAVIRNNLILLYGDVQLEKVTTREGKQEMLANAHAELNKILTETTGMAGIEAVYFTNLVVQ